MPYIFEGEKIEGKVFLKIYIRYSITEFRSAHLIISLSLLVPSTEEEVCMCIYQNDYQYLRKYCIFGIRIVRYTNTSKTLMYLSFTILLI